MYDTVSLNFIIVRLYYMNKWNEFDFYIPAPLSRYLLQHTADTNLSSGLLSSGSIPDAGLRAISYLLSYPPAVQMYTEIC